MTDKQVIFEEPYYNRICKIKFESNNKILIEIWHKDKGQVYIYAKTTEDILTLKRFFESIEVEERNSIDV